MPVFNKDTTTEDGTDREDVRKDREKGRKEN
jgi:hypothetical protein